MPRFIPDATPDDRRREVAGILAIGLLRYHRRVRPAIGPQRDILHNPQNGLDLSPQTRLHAHTAGPR